MRIQRVEDLLGLHDADMPLRTKAVLFVFSACHAGA
jgi:hypothetical protein